MAHYEVVIFERFGKYAVVVRKIESEVCGAVFIEYRIEVHEDDKQVLGISTKDRMEAIMLASIWAQA